jgi:hypothetical protein
MSLAVIPWAVSDTQSTALEESIMTAAYTFDVFSSLDGYGSHRGNWGGYWGKQGPEFLDHRLALYSTEQRMVFGANTYRQFVQMLGSSTEPDELDPVNARMRNLPTTVVSTTLNLRRGRVSSPTSVDTSRISHLRSEIYANLARPPGPSWRIPCCAVCC